MEDFPLEKVYVIPGAVVVLPRSVFLFVFLVLGVRLIFLNVFPGVEVLLVLFSWLILQFSFVFDQFSV